MLLYGVFGNFLVKLEKLSILIMCIIKSYCVELQTGFYIQVNKPIGEKTVCFHIVSQCVYMRV